MRKTMIIPVAALAAISFSAQAQDVGPPTEPVAPAPAFEASAEQRAAVESWPAPQQAQYAAWPVEVQAYFWSLTPERQDMFWHVRDADKLRVAQMPPEGQAQAWAMIESQVAARAQTEADPAAEPAPEPAPEPEPEPEPVEPEEPM